MDNSSLANFILQKQTGIPGGIHGALDNYAANPDSYSARNAVFQNLYKANQNLAADIAGQRTQGYEGLLGAIQQAYGAGGDQQQAAGSTGGNPYSSILPGNNTQSMLSILQRR